MSNRDFFQYLPPHPADRTWGVELIAGGRSLIGAGKTYPPPCHPNGHAFAWEAGRTLDEFQVVLIASGRGLFRGKSCGENALKAGDVLVLFPGEWHSYRPDRASGWDERWLAFSGEIPQRLRREKSLTPERPVIATASDPALADGFTHALDLLYREPIGYRAELAAAVLSILARLTAMLVREGTDEASAHTQVMRDLASRIHSDCPAQLDVPALAKEARLSIAQFRRVFTIEIGMSPKAYHQHIRLARARHLLADHQARIKDVAQMLGFASEFYFTRVFSRHHGVPPRAWRDR